MDCEVTLAYDVVLVNWTAALGTPLRVRFFSDKVKPKLAENEFLRHVFATVVFAEIIVVPNTDDFSFGQ